jgi:DNA-binding cell septation regulator SpoVG
MTAAASIITILNLSSPPDDLARAGLLAFVELNVGGLLRVSAMIRRRQNDGSLYVSFPAPTGRDGRPRTVVRPLDRAAREHIEREILAAVQRRVPTLLRQSSLDVALRPASEGSP